MRPPEDPLLWLIRRCYGHQWSIRHPGRVWIAVARKPQPDHAPVLAEDDVGVFVRQLEHPPGRGGVVAAVHRVVRRSAHPDR